MPRRSTSTAAAARAGTQAMPSSHHAPPGGAGPRHRRRIVMGDSVPAMSHTWCHTRVAGCGSQPNTRKGSA